MTLKISVCVIVRNEAKHLNSFLNLVAKFADEIIVVDTGSIDGSQELVKAFSANSNIPVQLYFDTQNLVSFHYGKARNVSLNAASGDYLLILDVDERPDEEFISKLRTFLEGTRPVVAQILRQDIRVKHLEEKINRIVERSSNVRYDEGAAGKVHEQLVFSGSAPLVPGVVVHDQGEHHHLLCPQHGLAQLELEIDRNPRTRSTMGHFLRGAWYFWFRFKKLYFTRNLRKDGLAGFKYAFIRALDALLIEVFTGLKQRPTDTSNMKS